jgi:ABC-type multidrug transport system fused ATPase/permease subunit
MTRLVFGLLRPYRGWLAIVFVAMLVEIVASLAAPWPLKLVLDDALGKHHLPDWLAWAHDYGFGRHALGVALFAGVATLVIAVVGAVATYIDKRWAMGRQRSANSHLRTSSSAFAAILRHRKDRHTDVDHHQRCRDHSELCIILDA